MPYGASECRLDLPYGYDPNVDPKPMTSATVIPVTPVVRRLTTMPYSNTARGTPTANCRPIGVPTIP